MLVAGSVGSAQAQTPHTTHPTPKPDPAVEIDEMRLLGNPKKGATVQLQVRYTAHVDAEGEIMLRFPKSLKPVNKRATERASTASVQLRAGKQYTETYVMRSDEAGASMVEFFARALDAPAGYSRNASQHINVVTGATQGRVIAPGDSVVTRLQAQKGPSNATPSGGVTSKLSTGYSFSIRGRVTYYDGDAYRSEGLYGTTVELWLKDSNNPDHLYHPISGNIHRVHYDEVEEDGSYHLQFGYQGDLSAYDEVVVVVRSSNPAASLGVDQGSYIIDDGSGSEDFFGASQGVSYQTSGTDTDVTNADIEINSKDGAILRNLMLSREVLFERYNGNPPFSIPVIGVTRKDLTDYCGLFKYDEHWLTGNETYSIEIDDACANLSTVPHEYGHYVNYAMWGRETGRMSAGTSELKEGWAIFYSFVVRNYGNDQYGSGLRSYDDNPETAPYDVGPDEDGNDVRFQNVGYAYVGSPKYAAFASYLWSIYDGYSGGPYETGAYDIGDNDEVSGYAQHVFEVFQSERKKYVSHFHDAVRSGLPSGVRGGISDLYDFMYADLTDVPSTRPPAAQVSNLSATATSNSVDLSWSSRSYSTSQSYANRESGYRIYQDGSLIATVPEGTTNYSYTGSNRAGQYKVTAYNAGGNSTGAPTRQVGPNVTISGPTFMNSGDSETWYANVSGGSGSIDYEWYYKWSFDANYSGPYSSSSSYSSIFTNLDSAPRFLTIRVVVDRGGLTASATQSVTVAAGGAGCEPGQLICEQPDPRLQTAKTGATPQAFRLDAPAPHPVTDQATMDLALPTASQVSLEIYDMMGRRIATPARGSKSAGFYTVQLDATQWPSGTYFYRVRVDGEMRETGRFTVVR